jgi:hypothetical protein
MAATAIPEELILPPPPPWSVRQAQLDAKNLAHYKEIFTKISIAIKQAELADSEYAVFEVMACDLHIAEKIAKHYWFKHKRTEGIKVECTMSVYGREE